MKRKFGWHRKTSPFAAIGWTAPRQSLSLPVFASVVVLTAAGGLLTEHLMDPYGLRRPEGPYQLTEIEPQEAQRLLASTQAIRDIDKIDGFALGTFTVAGYLVNPREEFKQGDTLIAEVAFTPPHEDMWVECNIHDSQDRIVERGGWAIMRENFRGYFSFPMCNGYEPGEYEAVLMCGGKEMLRRPFKLNANGNYRANAN